MSERDELFRVRDEIERHARKMMIAKNTAYADAEAPIANYEHAARVMGIPASLAITGRLAEQTWRLANLIRAGGLDPVEVVKSTEDLQNFPGLIAYALMREIERE